jgi:hypothetical protein
MSNQKDQERDAGLAGEERKVGRRVSELRLSWELDPQGKLQL